MFLNHVRVLDLTNVLAGPYCGHQLAHMGADVIKIEIPEKGDLARELGASDELNQKKMGISFLAQNAGKRSITLNLKSAKGKQLFEDLVTKSDVVLENFRPGVMNRLGLDYDSLISINPKLIYCAISGFGSSGEWVNRPAYDQIIQGLSGVMSITGDSESAPLRVGYPVADTFGGLTAAFAIVSALSEPQRKGCFIDVSMLESMLSSMGWVVSNFLNQGVIPKPLGNNNMTSSPSGAFKTQDGMINIAANQQQHFASICHVLGKESWLSDKRFESRQDRINNRNELNWLLEQELIKQPCTYWVEVFNQDGIPCGPVLTVPEVMNSDQIQSRKLTKTYRFSDVLEQKIEVITTGFMINDQRPELDNPPPLLGQHTHEILAELGYSNIEISALFKEGVL